MLLNFLLWVSKDASFLQDWSWSLGRVIHLPALHLCRLFYFQSLLMHWLAFSANLQHPKFLFATFCVLATLTRISFNYSHLVHCFRNFLSHPFLFLKFNLFWKKPIHISALLRQELIFVFEITEMSFHYDLKLIFKVNKKNQHIIAIMRFLGKVWYCIWYSGDWLKLFSWQTHYW